MSVSLVTLVPPVLHRLRSLFMAFLPHLPSSLALLSWLPHKTLLICSFWTCSACSSFCIHSLLSPFPFSLPFSLLTLERYFLMFLTVCLLCFISLRNSWARISGSSTETSWPTETIEVEAEADALRVAFDHL